MAPRSRRFSPQTLAVLAALAEAGAGFVEGGVPMTLSRTLSGWMMRLATRRPPPARAEWALAMQREFETMERGGLGWAFGCLTTRLGWTLRTQWLYLVLLALTPFY